MKDLRHERADAPARREGDPCQNAKKLARVGSGLIDALPTLENACVRPELGDKIYLSLRPVEGSRRLRWLSFPTGRWQPNSPGATSWPQRKTFSRSRVRTCSPSDPRPPS